MGRKDSELTGHEFERWYSDWPCAGVMVYLLSFCNRYGILKGSAHGELVLIGDDQEIWYSNWTWAVGVMNGLNLDKIGEH